MQLIPNLKDGHWKPWSDEHWLLYEKSILGLMDLNLNLEILFQMFRGNVSLQLFKICRTISCLLFLLIDHNLNFLLCVKPRNVVIDMPLGSKASVQIFLNFNCVFVVDVHQVQK
jgi:hypothetical protein